MVRIERETIGAHHRMVASEFDLTLQLVMARGAQTLPVGAIKEEGEVAFMSDNVVNDGGWSGGVGIEHRTETTGRIVG